MITGIVAGFGALLGPATLADLGMRGFYGIRQGTFEPHEFEARPGVPEPDHDPAKLDALIAEFESPVAKQYGMTPLWIASLKTLPRLPVGCWATFHNEPNLCGWSVEQYAEEVKRAVEIARTRNIRLHIGGASNTEPRNLQWTADVLRRVPEAEGIEFHDYGGPTGDPTKPHTGFTSREQGFRELLDVCGGRPIVIGEFGVRNAGSVTEQQQHDYIKAGFELYRTMGIEAAYVYQLNDGHIPEYWWGIRREDGTWKLAADVLRDSGASDAQPQEVGGMGYDRMLDPVLGSLAAHPEAGRRSLVLSHLHFDAAGGQPVYLSVSPDGTRDTRYVGQKFQDGAVWAGPGAWEGFLVSKCGGWLIALRGQQVYVLPLIEA